MSSVSAGLNILNSGNLTFPAVSTKTTFPHTLGRKPYFVRAVLICTTTDAGYAVGQELDIINASPTYINIGSTISDDATNIYLSTGSSGTTPFLVPPFAGGAPVYLTSTSWSLKFYYF